MAQIELFYFGLSLAHCGRESKLELEGITKLNLLFSFVSCIFVLDSMWDRRFGCWSCGMAGGKTEASSGFGCSDWSYYRNCGRSVLFFTKLIQKNPSNLTIINNWANKMNSLTITNKHPSEE